MERTNYQGDKLPPPPRPPQYSVESSRRLYGALDNRSPTSDNQRKTLSLRVERSQHLRGEVEQFLEPGESIGSGKVQGEFLRKMQEQNIKKLGKLAEESLYHTLAHNSWSTSSRNSDSLAGFHEPVRERPESLANWGDSLQRQRQTLSAKDRFYEDAQSHNGSQQPGIDAIRKASPEILSQIFQDTRNRWHDIQQRHLPQVQKDSSEMIRGSMNSERIKQVKEYFGQLQKNFENQSKACRWILEQIYNKQTALQDRSLWSFIWGTRERAKRKEQTRYLDYLQKNLPKYLRELQSVKEQLQRNAGMHKLEQERTEKQNELKKQEREYRQEMSDLQVWGKQIQQELEGRWTRAQGDWRENPAGDNTQKRLEESRDLVKSLQTITRTRLDELLQAQQKLQMASTSLKQLKLATERQKLQMSLDSLRQREEWVKQQRESIQRARQDLSQNSLSPRKKNEFASEARLAWEGAVR